jgi:hypothetical protein
MMKKVFCIFIIVIFSVPIYAQVSNNLEEKFTPRKRLLLKQSDIISVPEAVEKKILSGKLIQNISEKKYLNDRGLISLEAKMFLEVINGYKLD